MGEMTLLLHSCIIVLMHPLNAALYTWPLRHRPGYWGRLFLSMGVGLLLAYLYWVSGMASERVKWWMFGVMFLYIAGMVLLLCDQPVFGSLYCASWMLMSQQFFVQIYNAWYSWQWVYRNGTVIGWAWILPFAGTCSVLVYFLAVRGMAVNGRFQVGPRQTISAVLLFVVFEFLTVSIVQDFHRISLLGNWPVILMCEFYCLTILYLQNALFKKSAIQQNLDALDVLWHRQKEQYTLARRNISLINRRCHELKVQMHALRDMADSEERCRYLDEIDNSIGIYESIVKTGSEVLDTILTEKSLVCRDKNIRIQCVADGSQMGFLDPMDVYVIFGNALNNAIEAVQNYAETERRQIDVLIYVKQQFLVISVTNPLDVTLSFRDGLPVTTKGGSGYHGFGLKSVERTVRKYDGHLTIGTEQGCFALKILFPLPEQVQ